MTRWYGRKLDRSLDYRPITGLFALTMLGLVGFLYVNTSKELAPEEDQGIVFALTKAPRYANIDYLDYYGTKLEHALQKFPETDLSFVLNGVGGQQSGMAGMLLKAWDERKRSSILLKSLLQAELSKIEGINAFAFSLPPLPGGSDGLPVQMVINSTFDFQSVYEQMSKLKEAAQKSGLFMVSDSDLEFNRPVVRIKVDRSKANELGITMQTIGNALATLLGGNYVNRFNLQGRSYEVIPQVPREERLAPQAIGSYYVKTAGLDASAFDRSLHRDCNRSERAHPLQSAQLRDLSGCADARRHDRSGCGLPGSGGEETARRIQSRLPCRRAPICARG